MRETPENCASCLFYIEAAYGKSPVPVGFCRRYPPQVVMHEIDPPSISAQLPNVERTEWCGDWKGDK